MMFNKPRFWGKKNSLIALILLPFSFLVILIVLIKRLLTRSINFNIPIICVGNIYIGGTGKTPSSILIANELKKLGRNPAIVCKFYKSHKDEYQLIKKYFQNLIIEKDRTRAINEAEKGKFDSVILDDGFQDFKIKKNLNIICFNQNQLIGNGLVIPAGPLRESLNSLKEVDLILINGGKNLDFEKKILEINSNLEIFYCEYKIENIDKFKNNKVLALAGIGSPDNFFKILVENGIEIKKKISFPDHYDFKKDEIDKIIQEADHSNLKIIVPEKNFMKLKNFNTQKIHFLKVELVIKNKEKFFKRILEIYD